MDEKRIKKNRQLIPRRLKILFDVFEWTLFIVLICICFIMLSPVLPTNKYLQTYIVPSGSMEPTIHVGSVALIHVINPQSLQKGDIIAFIDPQDPKKNILHRIYSITSPKNVLTIQTKGDNNNGVDPWRVGAGLVKGKMMLAIPYVGYFSQMIKIPLGFILFVVAPAIILLLLQIKRIKIGIEEEVTRRTKIIADNLSKVEIMTFLIFLFGITLCFLSRSNTDRYGFAAYTGNVKISNLTFTLANASTPSPTPTTTITPTPTSGTIIITGNGAGSTNTVDETNVISTIVDQSNTTDVNNAINVSGNTGGNTITNSTGGSTTNTGLMTNTVSVTQTSNTNNH